METVEAMVIDAFKKMWTATTTEAQTEPTASISGSASAAAPSSLAAASRASARAANLGMLEEADDDIPTEEETRSTSTRTSFWDVLQEMSQSTTAADQQPTISSPQDQLADEITKLKFEIGAYSTQPNIDAVSNIYNWWSQQHHFVLLKRMARDFLSAPASSVYSEQLWSEGGNIYDEKRSRLLPENGAKLIFLHHNLPLMEDGAAFNKNK